MLVDANYFETMELPITQGRSFNNHEGSDRRSVLVNELFVNNLSWKNPVGQRFVIDTTQFEVAGVVKDFHSYSFAKPIRPTIFRVAEKSDYRFLSLKVRKASEVETYRTMR